MICKTSLDAYTVEQLQEEIDQRARWAKQAADLAAAMTAEQERKDKERNVIVARLAQLASVALKALSSAEKLASESGVPFEFTYKYPSFRGPEPLFPPAPRPVSSRPLLGNDPRLFWPERGE